MLMVSGLYGCIPAPSIKSPDNGGAPLVPRPVITLTATDAAASDLETAYVIVGDSITFTLRAEAAVGIKAIKTTRINSTSNNVALILKTDTITDGRTSQNYTFGYRVPNLTAVGSWIRLSFYVTDNNNQESFRHFRLNLLSPTRGTAIREVILYRQGLSPSVAQAGTVYAQFLSTRRQQTYQRYRGDLNIDLCYGVDPATSDAYLFSPDLPATQINTLFPLFPTSQIANPFAGGIRITPALTTANVPIDSLRQSSPNLPNNKLQKITTGQTYLVRCFPLDPLTPPYAAILNVTSMVDSIVFGSGPNRTVQRSPKIQMKANVAIIR